MPIEKNDPDYPKKLNARQRHFCINLATGMTQSDAYLNAGYNINPSIGSASDCASRLLSSNASVKAYYERLIERAGELSLAKITDSIMSPHEIKARLSQLARANLVDFIDKDGQPVLSKDTPGHQAAKEFYKKTRRGKDGGETRSIKLVDQIEALRELSKILGLYAPSRHLVASKAVFEVQWVDRGNPSEPVED